MTTKASSPLMMGAVAYAPKVVTIWEGFKEYFRRHDFEFDYILYSNYERQVQAQFDGSIALAWNLKRFLLRQYAGAHCRATWLTNSEP